ncbi:MAG: hypothetical protein COS99_06320 [Candidatus Omnitrophica bacterium CG07_land_8_20_14_0_80_42_15]|uniref:Uncharacterized protein n=1 Tax=Candidatus Aquitaenariimonas noxiae TaxID=1974741 RepID=A0A2J0L458_9BACT|nr:MAG: hypothetical protein COS99_06320 [Candidatus Omnitrophica bacterium CG07_land_8_20_14_0_80_42_15]
MSIISEALRKAHEINSQSKRKEPGKPNLLGPAIEPGTPTPKIKANKNISYLATLVIILILLTFAGFVILKSRSSGVNKQAATIAYDAAVKNTENNTDTVRIKEEPAAPIIENKPAAKKDFNYEAFDLSGIVFGGGKRSFAVINNDILEEGDMVGDAKIIRIEKNKVTLLFNNSEIVLNLKK